MQVYHHTHWDREWYEPFRVYQTRLLQVVRAILDQLPTLQRFVLDGQTVILDDLLAVAPELEAPLRAAVANGQLDIGPWYVMPDEFLVGGESLIRNLQRGIETARAWGQPQFCGYLPDTFGHSADMPTVLNGVGIPSAVLWRGVAPAQSVFTWQSPSGAQVTTLHLTDGYFQNMLHDPRLSPQEREDALNTLLAKLKAASPAGVAPLVPLGGDHLGPTPLPVPFEHTVTSPSQYLSQLPDHAWPVIEGELLDNSTSFILPGVWSARLYLKQANHQLEHRLTRFIEPLLVLSGLSEPHLLQTAWQQLLLNHPHDSICGCSIDAVHRANEARFDEVNDLCDSLQRLAEARLKPEPGPCYTVLNLGDRSFRGVVPITVTGDLLTPLLQTAETETVLDPLYQQDIYTVPLTHVTVQQAHGWLWADAVPAFGSQIVSSNVLPEDVTPVTAKGTQLSNGLITLNVTQGRVQLSTPDLTIPDFFNLTDRPDTGDSYNAQPDGPLEALKLLNTTVLHTGPLVGALKLVHGLGPMQLETTITLAAGSERVDFETRWVNLASNHCVQALFQTGDPIETVLAESHFGTVTRHYDPDFDPYTLAPVGNQQEVKPDTGPIQRFLAANGHAWFTEGLTEYEVHGSQLGITLLRSFAMLSDPTLRVRGNPAGPPFETPEGQCWYRQLACRYAWAPHTGPIHTLYEEANRFYGCVLAWPGQREHKPLIHWENPAVVSTALIPVDDGLLLRLLNTLDTPTPVTLRLGFAPLSIHRANLLGDPLRAATHTVTLSPHELLTLRFTMI
jgi:mannosylglycerate hydrolase